MVTTVGWSPYVLQDKSPPYGGSHSLPRPAVHLLPLCAGPLLIHVDMPGSLRCWISVSVFPFVLAVTDGS